MKQPNSGPPILRFLMLFTCMLVIVLGLAALAQADESSTESGTPLDAAGHAEPASQPVASSGKSNPSPTTTNRR